MTASVRLNYKACLVRMVKDVLRNRTARRIPESAIPPALSLANFALAGHEVKIKFDLKQFLKIFGEYVPAITMSHRRQLIGI